ncbi:MAG: hypothetical protein IJK68_06690 [Muribaculaceae bacterium]|nr:hypothetical protein [Muribaculaceae bacterium]MBR0025114.1 hypothetical protein [Muribaculaceae bacterium]
MKYILSFLLLISLTACNQLTLDEVDEGYSVDISKAVFDSKKSTGGQRVYYVTVNVKPTPPNDDVKEIGVYIGSSIPDKDNYKKCTNQHLSHSGSAVFEITVDNSAKYHVRGYALINKCRYWSNSSRPVGKGIK